MKASFTVLVMFTSLVYCTLSAFADSPAGENSSNKERIETHTKTPYVSINIGIEIDGLEAAAEQAAEGLELIGKSLRDIADHPEFSPERQQQLEQSLSRINQLSQSLTVSMEQLPSSVEKSMAPVVKVSNQLSGEIKQIIIIASIALILIILIALVAVYYYVLAPSTQAVIKTTKLLSELADTLESTASIVETASERNLQVMEEIRKARKI